MFTSYLWLGLLHKDLDICFFLSLPLCFFVLVQILFFSFISKFTFFFPIYFFKQLMTNLVLTVIQLKNSLFFLWKLNEYVLLLLSAITKFTSGICYFRLNVFVQNLKLIQMISLLGNQSFLFIKFITNIFEFSFMCLAVIFDLSFQWWFLVLFYFYQCFFLLNLSSDICKLLVQFFLIFLQFKKLFEHCLNWSFSRLP